MSARGPLETGSGTGVITGIDIRPVRDVGGNRFEDRTLQGTVDGALDGTFVQETSGKVDKHDRVVFRGRITFSGELENCGEGTIQLGMSGKGHIPEAGFPITEARVRVINQAENTIAITGTGTIRQEGPNLEYDIRYQCID